MISALKLARSVRQCSSSALFVSRSKAQNNFAVLTPHIDIEERYNNRDELLDNIEKRKLPIRLTDVESRWAFYLVLLEKRGVLELTKRELQGEIEELKNEPTENREKLDRLNSQLLVIKDEHYVLKNFIYDVEESAILKALSLPNVLHERTLNAKPEVIHSFLPQPTHESNSHIDIGIKNRVLDLADDQTCYLTNDAALFEQGLQNYFQTSLLNMGYTQFSSSDFSKSVVVEGCATNFHSSKQVITVEDGSDHPISRLHLTGGASHYAFMAYFTKNNIQPSLLPMKYFSIGRKYQPTDVTNPISLVNLRQQSAIEVFIGTKDCSEKMNAGFDSLVAKLTSIYEKLNMHFRFVIQPADKIAVFESLRLSIQMYSNHQNQYVEVGNVSICDDFLCKRLLFVYTEEGERKFPKVIMGNILNVHKVLACRLENGSDDLLDCEILKQHVPI